MFSLESFFFTITQLFQQPESQFDICRYCQNLMFRQGLLDIFIILFAYKTVTLDQSSCQRCLRTRFFLQQTPPNRPIKRTRRVQGVLQRDKIPGTINTVTDEITNCQNQPARRLRDSKIGVSIYTPFRRPCA